MGKKRYGEEEEGKKPRHWVRPSLADENHVRREVRTLQEYGVEVHVLRTSVTWFSALSLSLSSTSFAGAGRCTVLDCGSCALRKPRLAILRSPNAPAVDSNLVIWPAAAAEHEEYAERVEHVKHALRRALDVRV